MGVDFDGWGGYAVYMLRSSYKWPFLLDIPVREKLDC